MAALQRRSGAIPLLLFIACLAGLPSQVWSQTNLPEPGLLQLLRAQLPDEVDTAPGLPAMQFGQSISVFGDTALIGMPVFENVGRVAVFRRDASGLWQRQGSIESPDGLSGGNFGFRVRLLRDAAFVAFGDGNIAGTHIFRRKKDGFDLVRSTPLSFIVDRPTGLLFSGSPAADGSVVMRVFRLTGRGRLHRVQRFVIPADMAQGQSVVWDDTFVVATRGAGFVFERRRGSWRFTQKLIAADGNPLGDSVAIHGDTIVIGAPGADPMADPPCDAPRSGAVYAFKRRHHLWSEDQKIVSLLDNCVTNFGQDLVFNGKLLLVTNIESNTFGGDAGWHVFERQFGLYQPIAFRVVDTNDRPARTSFALQGETLFYGVGSRDQDDRGSVSLWDLRPDQ